MVLENVFTKESIIIGLESTEKDELFEEMVEAIHSLHPDFDRAEVLSALEEREAQMSTGIMHSVAVPHAFAPSINVRSVLSVSAKTESTTIRSTVHLFMLFLCFLQEMDRPKSIFKF